MEVKMIYNSDRWQRAKDMALNTVGKEGGAYPSSEWKRKIIMAEHSPIRELEFTLRFTDIPYFVVMHLVRHHEGCRHYVESQRTDRTESHAERSELPQDALINYTLVANTQALINISRKRLCGQADPQTRTAWRLAVNAVAEHEPELAALCVPECIRCGFCPEMKPCGYADTDDAVTARKFYTQGRKVIPTDASQIELDIAYIRGKTDGIKECTEKLKKQNAKMRDER